MVKWRAAAVCQSRPSARRPKMSPMALTAVVGVDPPQQAIGEGDRRGSMVGVHTVQKHPVALVT